MLNKLFNSLLRSDTSEGKDTVHIAQHVTNSFAKKEPEFWNHAELHQLLSESHTDMQQKAGAAAAIISCL